jgi:hypothetical protein
MKIDIDHILFWMDAIRNSSNKDRTLESFWKGQIKSKIWLIDNLMTYVPSSDITIVIHGGWNGVLASLLFQTTLKISKIVSIDIDRSCEDTANTMNKIEEIEGRFQAVTCDMTEYYYKFIPNIVINTSCEHITQETYEKWLSNVPKESIIVLQSNDYFELNEHIRCANDIDEFIEQSKIKVFSYDILELPKYNRFMIIGRRDKT